MVWRGSDSNLNILTNLVENQHQVIGSVSKGEMRKRKLRTGMSL